MHFDYCQHFVFILQLLPAEHQSHLRSTSKIVDLKRNFFYCISARCACIIEAWTAKNRVDSNFILLFVCYIERVSVSFINVKFPRNQHNDTHNASIDAHTRTHTHNVHLIEFRCGWHVSLNWIERQRHASGEQRRGDVRARQRKTECAMTKHTSHGKYGFELSHRRIADANWAEKCVARKFLFFSRPNENYFMIILRVVVTMCKGMSSGMNETRRKLSETGI